MTGTTTRLLWVDAVKCIAIFCVLWGHCIQHLAEGEMGKNSVFLFIYSFHMPLFMILSGFFADKLLKRRFRQVFTAKSLQLVFPAVVWGAALFLVWRLLFPDGPHSVIRVLWYSFWFLKSLFVCVLLFIVGARILCPRVWLGLSLVFLAVQLVDFEPHLSILQIRYMFPCFLLGYAFKCFQTEFDRCAAAVALTSGVCFLLLLPSWNQELMWPKINFFKMSVFPGCDTICGQLYTVYYKLLIGAAGGVFALASIRLLCAKLPGAFLEKAGAIGKHTLGIYILQTFILEVLIKEYADFSGTGIYLFSLVYAPVLSAAVLWCCVEICRFCERSGLGWLFDFNKFNQGRHS
ncbi:MAG: acyltransferase family protein [Akkermansiaceae bacterium]|nr:acyltransferase family protein [Akkermansiaceae bacterium]